MKHALIDFEDYGYRGYLPIAVLEMRMLLEGAQGLLDQYEPDAVEEMLIQEHTNLFLQAFQRDRVTAEWVSKATLLVALNGLRGEKLPDIVFDD